MKSLTINEFCVRHRISLSLYFKLAAAGEGPKTFKIGRRTLITEAAADEWLNARVAEAA